MAPRRRASERLNLEAPAVLTRSELREISREVGGLERHNAELERRNGDLTASLEVVEPPIYGAGSGHSYFADMLRVSRRYGQGDGGLEAAERRLHNHQAYQHHENERRLAARTAQAERATERALSQSAAEARLLQRWQAAGGQLFDRKHEMREIERRGMTAAAGSGAAFVPPGWLIDQFVHAPRAGAPFAALWANLPLPPKVSSVNLPRLTVGARAGIQVGGGSPLGTADPADSYIGCPVLTLAAQVDVSMQWLDMCPVPPDETIGADLAEAFMTNLDGQLLLGSGPALGQLPGIIPAGQFSAANMVWLSSTNNTAAQSWANGTGATPGIAGSLHQMTAQLKRKIARYRALPATHWIAPSSLWDIISGSGVDAQNRPLVPPGMHSPSAVPMLHGLPVVGDENIPETFGGSVPPVMSAVSAGRVAPADGNGTWVPVILGRWKDCLYFQSEPVIRIMDEALSGAGQVRFQAYSYVAAHPGRVVWGGSSGTFSAASQAGGLNNGAPVSYGALTNFTANSPLQPAANGY